MAIPFALIAAGIGASSQLAGLGMGIFGKKRSTPNIDISGELAKIDSLINTAREQARSAINIEAGAGRRMLASRLATQGVYSSPASSLPFEAFEGQRLAAIGRSEADLLGQGASLRAGALGQLTEQRFGAERENAMFGAQDRAGIASALSSFGSSLFFNSPYFRAGAQENVGAGGFPGLSQSFPTQQSVQPQLFDRNPRAMRFF